MLQTYKATLRGNILEWNEEMPEQNKDIAVEVYVTVLSNGQASSDKTSQGRRMADALEKLASNNSLAGITDPVAWQREQREERPLPDRE